MHSSVLLAVAALATGQWIQPRIFDQPNLRSGNARELATYLEFAPASGAGLPVAENLCDALAAEVPNWADGATSWCASSRTGAWASAAGSDVTAWSEVNSPTYTTVPVVPSGPDGSTRIDLQLNGTDQRVDSASVASPTGDVTVCALVMPMESPATQYGVLVGRDGAARVLVLDYTSGAYRVQPFYEGVGAGTAVSGGVAQEGVLSLVCGVYDYVTSGTSSVKLYVDGASVGTPITTAAGPLVVSSQPYSIGFEGTSSTYASTSIGGALVVEQSLSAAQIAAIARRVLADQPKALIRGSPSLALTYTRTGNMFCSKADNTGTILPANRPCISQNGILVEAAATNVVLRSQEFDNAAWPKYGGNGGASSPTYEPVVTANYGLAPDGTKTAERVQFKSVPVSATDSIVYQSGVYPASGRASVFVRATAGTPDGGVGSIDLVANGNCTQCAVLPDGGWSRCTTGAGATGIFGVANTSYALCGGGARPAMDVLLWGAQSETGSVATSYIPTLGATAARGVSTVAISGLAASPTPNVSGCMSATFDRPSTYDTSPLNLTATTSTAGLLMYQQNATTFGVYRSAVIGAQTVTLAATGNRGVVSWVAGDYTAKFNGTPSTGSGTAPASNFNVLQLGDYNLSHPLGGRISAVQFDTRPSRCR